MPRKKEAIKLSAKTLRQATLQKLEKAFSAGMSDLEACYFADVSQNDFREYLKMNPEFAEKREALKQVPVMIARQTVLRAIKKDPKIALEFLDRVSGMK